MKATNCECKFEWSSLGHVRLTLFIRIQNVSLHSLFVWINQQYLPTWNSPGTYALGVSNTFSRPVYAVCMCVGHKGLFLYVMARCVIMRFFLNSEAKQVMAHDKFTRETLWLLITYSIHLQTHQSSYIPKCLAVYVHIIYLLWHLELSISWLLLCAEPYPWQLSLPKLKC